MGKNNLVHGILSRIRPHNKINHCIIHQQSLTSKDMSLSFCDVEQVVISPVSFMKARDMNFCIFIQLCITDDSNHSTFLIHTAVRGLSRGKTLGSICLLCRKLVIFSENQGHKLFL